MSEGGVKVAVGRRAWHDGVNAYLVPLSDAEAFRTQVEHALDELDERAIVGLRGRQAARREFDYGVHGGGSAQFLRELRTAREGQADQGRNRWRASRRW